MQIFNKRILNFNFFARPIARHQLNKVIKSNKNEKINAILRFKINSCPRQAKIASGKLFFDPIYLTDKLTKHSIRSSNIIQDYFDTQIIGFCSKIHEVKKAFAPYSEALCNFFGIKCYIYFLKKNFPALATFNLLVDITSDVFRLVETIPIAFFLGIVLCTNSR